MKEELEKRIEERFRNESNFSADDWTLTQIQRILKEELDKYENYVFNAALSALEEKMPPEGDMGEVGSYNCGFNEYRSQLLTILKSLRK